MTASTSRMWLWGDRIFTGAAHRLSPPDHAPVQAAAEPLWPLRDVASTINLLVGWEAARFQGFTGLPRPPTITRFKLRRKLRRGDIAQGDSILMLDVGDHFCDPDKH